MAAAADMGTIFRITTNGVFTTLVSFHGTNGARSLGGTDVGPDRQLYGTTQLGGSASSGTVFKVTTNGVLTTLVLFPQLCEWFQCCAAGGSARWPATATFTDARRARCSK